MHKCMHTCMHKHKLMHKFKLTWHILCNKLCISLIVLESELPQSIVIALSLALGLFVLMGIGGFILVMTAVFAVRNWWYRRRPVTQHDQGIRREPRPEKQIIEGEYQEVPERKRDERSP